MGANTGRVMSVLVSNAIAANTGNSLQTIVKDDLILFNKNYAVVADAGKVTDAGNDLVYVAAGKALGKMKFSNPIQVSNIRKIRVTPFEATAQHKVTVVTAVALPAGKLVAGGEYGIAIQLQDNHRQLAEQPTREFYYFKAAEGVVPTAAQVMQGLADKINGVNVALASMRVKNVSASVVGGNLVIEGLPVQEDGNGINTYQFRYFDVLLRSGFDHYAAGAITKTVGKPGKGIGLKVIDLEQSTLGRQFRFTWPIKETPKVALPTGKYNLVTIEHGHEHIGDLQRQQTNPVTTVIAFKVDDTTVPGTDAASAKQASFITKLTSLAASAGIRVE